MSVSERSACLCEVIVSLLWLHTHSGSEEPFRRSRIYRSVPLFLLRIFNRVGQGRGIDSFGSLGGWEEGHNMGDLIELGERAVLGGTGSTECGEHTLISFSKQGLGLQITKYLKEIVHFVRPQLQ